MCMPEKTLGRTSDWVEQAFAGVADTVFAVNQKLWELAEFSGQEYRSAELLTQVLQEHGFALEKNLCGRPTAFLASWGSGHPVIGLLGEYDALPGLSQKAGVPRQEPVPGQAGGHGCGHCALGSGSLGAALLLRQYLAETGLPGTIRYYGCCDEEVDGVKPHMAKAGYFDDADCVFAWHPGGETGVPNSNLIAMQALEVQFTGERDMEVKSQPGRAACELMNIGVNYLRSAVLPEARIHYAYVDAEKPVVGNISTMGLKYSVRAPKASQVDYLVQRVIDCAEGAARMAGAQARITLKNRYADRFQNSVVARILSDAAETVGPPRWEEGDFRLAREYVCQYDGVQRKALEGVLHRRYPEQERQERLEKPLDTRVEPFDPGHCKTAYASSDVGDVGYAVPTASMRVACSALGSPAHSWFLTGMVASSIGQKGIACAAKILALAGIRVLEEPGLLAGAQEERLTKITPV